MQKILALLFSLVLCAVQMNVQAQPISQNQLRNAIGNGCSISRKEEIVCANIMCDFGIIFQEFPDECWDYKAKLAILKARTPPWKSLPRCIKRDKNCRSEGRANKQLFDPTYCFKDSIGSRNDQELCLGALRQTEPNYCSKLGNGMERRACEEVKSRGRLSDEYCHNQAKSRSGLSHVGWWVGNFPLPQSTAWDELEPEQQERYNREFQSCISLVPR